jgi:4-hydroxybenzoate polyprenyltransferase
MGDRQMVSRGYIQFTAFLRLIRFQNLVMIALTQVLLRYFVMQKILNAHGLILQLSDGFFFLVVLSTVLIAAGGYIINDYFDVKTDLINHPGSVVVDRVIKRRWAIVLHMTFTIAGVLIGTFTAYKAGYLRLSFFNIAAALLLWFYSTHFKRMLLAGNLVVSVLTAAVALMPFLYEMGAMQRMQPDFIFTYRHAVISSLKLAWIFSIFAFITTLAREIIKDIEDYEGDKATGCQTMPIVWGIRASKLNAFFLLLITSILLLFVLYNTIRFERVLITLNNSYIFCALVLPLLGLAVYTLRAGRSKHFRQASFALKLIMLMGLCYSFIFYYK